jgi:hypothetical protein
MPRLFLATGPLALGALLLAGPAPAQGPASSASAAAAAQAAHPSAFEGYRRFEAQPVTPWRESNDTVGRIGGWKVYAREAQQPGPAPAQPAAGPAANPAPAGAPAPGGGQPAPSAAPAGAHRGHAH